MPRKTLTEPQQIEDIFLNPDLSFNEQ